MHGSHPKLMAIVSWAFTLCGNAAVWASNQLSEQAVTTFAWTPSTQIVATTDFIVKVLGGIGILVGIWINIKKGRKREL